MSRARRVLTIVFRLAILAAGVAVLLHFANLHELADAFHKMRLPVFAGALALDWGFYLVETWRIRRLSLGRYRFGALLRARMVATLVTNVLPGMASGEVLRVFLIDRNRPGNKLYVGLLLLANRLYGVLALASLFLIGFAVEHRQLPPFVAAHLPLLVGGCLLVLPTPLWLRVRPVRAAMVRGIRRLRGRLKRVAYVVFNAIGHFCDPRRWAVALASSTLSNALLVLQFWVIGRAVGADLSLLEWTVCVPVAAFASFLPIGVGSVGPQDASIVVIGHLTGHAIEPLLAVSVLLHVVQIVGTLPGLLWIGDSGVVIKEALRAGRAVARRARRSV